MASGELSLKITVSGSDFYVSDSEFLNTDGNFHYGSLLSAPTLTLSKTRGGYANFKTGSVVLENRPLDLSLIHISEPTRPY